MRHRSDALHVYTIKSVDLFKNSSPNLGPEMIHFLTNKRGEKLTAKLLF